MLCIYQGGDHDMTSVGGDHAFYMTSVLIYDRCRW